MVRASRVPPPPRDLKVQLFAEARSSELESLHAIVADRLNHDYRECRGKRRRTTSYDARISRKGRGRKRQKIDGGCGGSKELEGDDGGAKKENMTRRMRRKAEFRENSCSGFVVSADGTKRLRTHLWHAKRFTMVKKWGFFLPLGLHGRGRGSKTVLKWMKTGTVVHDASYCSPVHLEGPKDSLLAVMEMVLVPSLTASPKDVYRQIICGVRHGTAQLHQIGAPDSHFIAPVNYMWRPPPKNMETEIDKENNNTVCQLWVWMHTLAFHEGFNALSSACLKQKNESGIYVSCSSLEGRLAKYEVMGFKATHSLQKLLCPLQSHYPCKDSLLRNRTASQVPKSYIFEHVQHLPGHAVLSLEVCDPRDMHSMTAKTLSDSHPTRPDTDLERQDPNQIYCFGPNSLDAYKEALLALWTEPENNGSFLSDSKMLWTAPDQVKPPVKDSILCSEKHKRRLKCFYMDEPNACPSDTRDMEDATASCPILILKHNNQGDAFTWWSIILPLSWAKAFWVPLVSSGAHAIGLRERRWISCDNGLPSFPFDFPDSKAYSLSMASEAAAADQNSQLLPPHVRFLRVPVPPPWQCVKQSLNKKPSLTDDLQVTNFRLCEEDIDLSQSSSTDLEQDTCCSTSLEGAVLPSIDFVARTSDVIQNLTDGKLCFLRVLLRSFKEGTFEEGSVVCAPTLGDISIWTSRSNEQEKLQIPQSLVSSYFTEKSPGHWELHIPEDQSFNHRWPLGFVTTGFVHGSSKPVAVALCEATLLAQLRAEQANAMEKMPEIFVLVRNLRSSAYRLALATVVLDRTEDDLHFF